MKIAALAAVCMVVQDVLGTVLVIAESKERTALSAILDAAMWIAGITTTSYSVSALQGHNTSEKILLVSFVTAANLGGTALGVWTGKKFVKK